MENDWLRHPDRCWATVSRGPRHLKEDGPCDKPAIAVAIYDGDEHEHSAYPVCRHHARGRPMLPLKDLIEIVRGHAP